jgi:hypothetical protein
MNISSYLKGLGFEFSLILMTILAEFFRFPQFIEANSEKYSQ